MKRLVVLIAASAALVSCRTTQPAPSGVSSEASKSVSALPPVDEAALDRSVDPCEDFYAFACGGWIARTEIPADKPRWSRGFDELRESNRRALREILDTDVAGKGDAHDRFVDKVTDYYASCMDEKAVEEHGLDELRAEWAKLDGVNNPAALANAVARLTGAGISAPFSFTSDQDAKDATQMIGIITQAGLSLPDRDYYLEDNAKMAEVRHRFAQHLRKMLALAGVPQAEIEPQAVAIESLEKKLAESHWTRVEMRDPNRVYNRVNLEGLEKLAPHFPWKLYLSAIGHPDVHAISVTTPPNIEKIDALVTSVPMANWRTYLKWQLLSSMAHERALPKAFVDEDFAFTSAAFTGAAELEARWKHCVSSTDNALGEALGQSYVRLHFGGDSKERSSAIVAAIEKAMQADLDGLTWMDAPTREKAVAKLHKVENKIGYPQEWRDYTRMETTRASFFRNVLAAGSFEIDRELRRIGKPVDRKEWLMSPPTVNAYYNPTMNEMVFPAGILQPPFFNPVAPPSVNYGAIGMVMGHELTHGFDDEGRRYDAQGNLTDWWTPSVSQDFDRRAECLSRQYDSYVAVGDLHLNGKLTLGENIADLGGLKLAYAAWKAAHAAAPGGTVAGFSPEQQFFVGFAQGWCQKTRDPFARMLVTVDPHSPPKFRVDGPLSNLAEFGAAFQCKAGAKMVRAGAERCEVW